MILQEMKHDIVREDILECTCLLLIKCPYFY